MTWMSAYPPTRAGLLRRLAAMAYDTLVLFALFMLAGFCTIIVTSGEAVAAGNPWFQALLLLIAISYFCGSWLRGGQTIGMKAWRLRVVRMDGNPLDARSAALRFVTAALSWVVFALGFLWILIDPQGRAWHDRLSGTRLVRIPKV